MPRNTTLINRAAVRRALLHQAEATRHHKFTRVDPAVLDHAEARVRVFVNMTIATQPSAGKTIHLG